MNIEETFLSMNENIIQSDSKLIRDLVLQFDHSAEVTLFGPGIHRFGKSMDVYIYSHLLTEIHKSLIKEKLVNNYRLNIDFICILRAEIQKNIMNKIGHQIVAKKKNICVE
ncbi:MAG: hypothetical protein PF541_04155 [Prolixibacteraceae bacterium]|nr:hypothetical protein [Prolixibacteraceae bacterium]